MKNIGLCLSKIPKQCLSKYQHQRLLLFEFLLWNAENTSQSELLYYLFRWKLVATKFNNKLILLC